MKCRTSIVCAAALAAASGAAAADFTTPYSLARSVACIRTHGATVTKVPRRDAARRQLADVAQRNSRQVHIGRWRIGIAFARDVAGARLLTEVLYMPRSGYVVRQKGTVVLLYKPTDRPAVARITPCLRR